MISISNTSNTPFRAATIALAMGLAAAGLAAAAPCARAQDSNPPATTRQLPSPGDIVNTLGEKLKLTDDQKARIKPIIVERRQKMQDLRADTSMRRFQKRRKMRSILEASDKKINAVLNDQQKRQYAQLKEQMREEAREQMQDRESAN